MWYEYEPLLTSGKLRSSSPNRVNKKWDFFTAKCHTFYRVHQIRTRNTSRGITPTVTQAPSFIPGQITNHVCDIVTNLSIPLAVKAISLGWVIITTITKHKDTKWGKYKYIIFISYLSPIQDWIHRHSNWVSPTPTLPLVPCNCGGPSEQRQTLKMDSLKKLLCNVIKIKTKDNLNIFNK